MAEGAPIDHDARVARRQLLVLLVVGALVFYPVLKAIFLVAIRNPDVVHAFAAPLLIGLLIYWRRDALRRALGRGSVWGLVLLLGSLAVTFAAQFPLNYNLPRWWAMIPGLAGLIWAAAGWKFLVRCLPMLLILGLAIPINVRFWAYLVIRPETITTQLTEQILDLLPGIYVELIGSDLHYERGSKLGAIALGQHFRGVQLLLTYATIYVFVTFSRIRPSWQLAILAVAMVPVVLICNLARLVIWGVVTIYAAADPVSPLPRMSATALSLLLAYALTAGLVTIVRHLAVTSDETAAPAPTEQEPA